MLHQVREEKERKWGRPFHEREGGNPYMIDMGSYAKGMQVHLQKRGGDESPEVGIVNHSEPQQSRHVWQTGGKKNSKINIYIKERERKIAAKGPPTRGRVKSGGFSMGCKEKTGMLLDSTGQRN